VNPSHNNSFERDDPETDLYVSDCNRLPFTEPLTQGQRVGCALICLLPIVCCAIIGGLYALLR